MHATYWSETLNGKEHMINLGVEGRVILKCNINESN
jgi:hypothetical protein